jgi:hypothetical protein
MISPGILNLTLPQGSTWDLSLTYNDSSGSPVNLTDYTAKMQVRNSFRAPTAVLTLSNSNGIALGGSAGTINIGVVASVTETISAESYVYDLELTTQSGVVTRLVQGTLLVTPEVTKH